MVKRMATQNFSSYAKPKEKSQAPSGFNTSMAGSIVSTIEPDDASGVPSLTVQQQKRLNEDSAHRMHFVRDNYSSRFVTTNAYFTQDALSAATQAKPKAAGQPGFSAYCLQHRAPTWVYADSPAAASPLAPSAAYVPFVKSHGSAYTRAITQLDSHIPQSALGDRFQSIYRSGYNKYPLQEPAIPGPEPIFPTASSGWQRSGMENGK